MSKELRKLGNFTEKLIKENSININNICKELNISEYKFKKFLKGIFMLPFNDLIILSELLNVSIESLLLGDEEYYNNTVVVPFGNFTNYDNMDKALDIIESYIYTLVATQ